MLEGWQTFSGEDLTTKITKGSSPKWQGFEYQPEGVLFVTSENVRDGFLDISEPKYLPFEFSQKARNSRLMHGDILVNIVGASIGRVCRFDLKGVEANVNQAVCILRLKPEFEPDFFLQLLQAPHVQKRLLGERSDSARPNLSLTDFREFTFDLPPLPEQRRIAEILRTWDEAIQKLEALRTAKERRLHILREKLTYADVHHEPVRLGDVTNEVTTRNGTGRLHRDKVMGVTNSRGIVPMREQTIAGDISRYKIVADQSFAYNPMRINVGSIARNQTGEEILVSPDYVAFACNPDGLLPDYLDHLRNTKWWAHYINSGGSGSVRQRTYYGDLAAMKVPLPAVTEQQRIADALNTAQRDAEATAREITALQRQKRGLMQKLLTGEWRVSVDEMKEAAE